MQRTDGYVTADQQGRPASFADFGHSCLSTDVFYRTIKTTDPGKPGALSGGAVQQHARAHLMKPLREAAVLRQPSPRPISVRCSPYRRFVGTAARGSASQGCLSFCVGRIDALKEIHSERLGMK